MCRQTYLQIITGPNLVEGKAINMNFDLKKDLFKVFEEHTVKYYDKKVVLKIRLGSKQCFS